MKSKSVVLGLCLTLSGTGVASAQEEETDAADESSDAASEAVDNEDVDEEDVGEEESEAQATDDADHPTPAATGGDSGAPSSAAGGDGGRFRFGVAVGAGPLTTDGLDMTYYGLDLRFGWQLDDALAVYAQPQLGYYQLDGASALFGSGGLLGTSVLVDYTLLDRFFVGGGVGYAILNNPSGTEVHLRVGGYPIVSRSDAKVRRRGLMLGLDFRMHFVEDYTFMAPTFNIGYDAF